MSNFILSQLEAIKAAVAEIENALKMKKSLSGTYRKGTPADAGLSFQDVSRIVLKTIVNNNGRALMKDLYAPVEAEMNTRGWSLSFNGRASVRRQVNETAVLNGYIDQHNPSRPGWRITHTGRRFIS